MIDRSRYRIHMAVRIIFLSIGFEYSSKKEIFVVLYKPINPARLSKADVMFAAQHRNGRRAPASHNSSDWSRDLHNGVVTTGGRPPRIASGMVTKSNQEYQLANHAVPTLEVIADNGRNAGLRRNSKQMFSVHRSMSFLPQE